MRVTLRVAAVVLALVLPMSSSWAQGRDADAADALFREGRALFKKGEYDAACPKFEESYRLDPAAGTGINLGDCFEKQGKVASALLAYQAAFALLGAADPRVAPVKLQIAALEKRTPRLTIKLAPGAPEGTEVKRDGRAVEPTKLGVALAANPGKRRITVTAPGREKRSYQIELREAQASEITVDVGAATDADGATVAPADRKGTERPRARESGGTQPQSNDSSQRTIGYVAAGAGVVALGVAAVFRVQANAKYDEAGCTSSKCPPSSLADEADAKVKDATVAAVVGGLALTAGVVLVLTSPAPDQRAARLRIAPRLLAGGGGALIGGAW